MIPEYHPTGDRAVECTQEAQKWTQNTNMYRNVLYIAQTKQTWVIYDTLEEIKKKTYENLKQKCYL